MAQARTDERVSELAAAQARTDERVNELAVAQARTEERINQLAEAQARTERELQELIQVVRRIEERQAAMEETLRKVQTTVATTLGEALETCYRRHADAYFGRLLRKIQVFSVFDLEEELEPRLPVDDYLDLAQIDLVVRSKPRVVDLPELWLAVEVAAVVNQEDRTSRPPCRTPA